MDYRKKLFDKYVSVHTSGLYGLPTMQEIRKQFVIWCRYFTRHLPHSKEVCILDIGCGNGGFVHWLHEIGYRNSFGIDISSEQIELGRKLGITDITQADLMEFLQDKKQVYDLIFARDILEHFRKEEVMEVLELVSKALNKDGKVIIKTPNAESPFAGRYMYGDFTHEIAFTQNSLAQVLRAVGLEKIKFYPEGPVRHGLKSAVRCLLWKIIEIFLRIYLLIETGNAEGILTQNLIVAAEK